ncbi:hypothetical protein [Xanthomonas phage BUDD]|nr:hypothetical protein [Xanthomonas phage BUDD]
MSELTVGRLKKFLEQFDDSTEVIVQGPSWGPMPLDVDQVNGVYNTSGYGFVPAQAAWTYVPTEEAKSRGNVEKFHPARPAELYLGDYGDFCTCG